MKNFSLIVLLSLSLLIGCKTADSTSSKHAGGYPKELISTAIVTKNIPTEIAESQTPINIDTAAALVLHSSDPVVHYGTMKLGAVINNEGENLKVSTDSADKANNYIVVGGKTYHLAQFHFHYNSEHSIAGHYSTMEIHFVNVADDNSYAVLGVMVEEGLGSAALEKLFAEAPHAKGATNSPNTLLHLDDILPTPLNQYYTYSGSLTTPNYGANSMTTNGGPVTWFVFKNAVQFSKEQFHMYKEVFEEANFRVVQPLNGRKVYKNSAQ